MLQSYTRKSLFLWRGGGVNSQGLVDGVTGSQGRLPECSDSPHPLAVFLVLPSGTWQGSSLSYQWNVIPFGLPMPRGF